MKSIFTLIGLQILTVISSICMVIGIFQPCNAAQNTELIIAEPMAVRTLEYIHPQEKLEIVLSIDDFVPFDVPVGIPTQEYVQEICLVYGVPEELVYAIMSQESNFTVDVISRTNDYGIMQINQMNHEWLSNELEITDFLDEKQNILAGVFMLGELYTKFDDTERVLMAYNCGPTGASRLWEQGIYQTDYSEAVLAKMEGLRRIENE